ncbi:DUF4260 domain-containing protein [Sphingobacterium corticis]|uniref:DUF4260 domain-containing protein n=1 Tax=Sphingobacterium corticis TaxID=1812823 RepID=A0ABW5NIG0_9SPHI
MKKILQAEAIAPFIISVLLIHTMDVNFAWWIWILIFLLPDLSMFGYAFGNRVGAISYNVLHHQTFAAILAIFGFILQLPYVELAGLVLIGHSSLDRLMGYGLKLEAGFQFTHLGTIGHKRKLSN